MQEEPEVKHSKEKLASIRETHESQCIVRKRSLSASAKLKHEDHKARNEDVIPRCSSVSRQHFHVIPKQTVRVTSAMSMESVYDTPPTSRRTSTTSRQLNTVKLILTVSAFPSSYSHHLPVPTTPPIGYQELLRRLEEVEQKGQKRHEELLQAFADLSKKFASESEGITRDAGVHMPEGKTHQKISGSSLPQNVPVSSDVILKLSKSVTTNWKFLGRWLKIPNHELKQIEANYKEDIHEQSYQMLLKWTQSNGGGSYQVLGEAIRNTFEEQLCLDYVEMVTVPKQRHL